MGLRCSQGKDERHTMKRYLFEVAVGTFEHTNAQTSFLHRSGMLKPAV